MGSLTSRPKISTGRTKVVYVPTPSVSSVSDADSDGQDAGLTEEEENKKRRKNSLLRRDRGVFGTVLTGFRGLLEPASAGTGEQRKTLLGE